jgi:hypothetical protein
MTQVQLPPKFQPHPEVAAGAITLNQAVMMIRRGWLTHDGARFLLPPRAWPYLPQPEPQQAQAEQPKRFGLIHSIKNWSKQYARATANSARACNGFGSTAPLAKRLTGERRSLRGYLN